MNFKTKEGHFFYIALIGAFLFYQAVNFIYLPLGTTFGDEDRFIREAIKLYNTGEFWTDSDRAWEMPFTAIVYSMFYSIFDYEEGLIASVRIFQSILLIFQALLLRRISLLIFKSETGAFITLVTVLFYPYFVFYQGMLLSETLFNTALVLSFYYIYGWFRSGFNIDKYFFYSNLFLVATIYVKGTLTILPPLLLTAFFLFNTLKLKDSIRVLLYSIVLYGIFMSPWWVRNYSVFNQFVGFTTSSGLVFYLGNNSENKTGGNDITKDIDLREVESILSIDDELARKEIFMEKGVRFIVENPDDFFRLSFLKFKRYYNIVPNAAQYSQGYYKLISIASYGVIFLLFLISIFVHIKHFKKLSAIYILFFYFTLLHVVTIASLRYRLPLELFMILLSSDVLSRAYNKLHMHKA
jgi:hypothetical protein